MRSQRTSGVLEAGTPTDGCAPSRPLAYFSPPPPPSLSTNLLSKADLRRQETALVCCSANWGAGGYLSVRPNNNNNNNATRGGDSASCPEPAAAAEADFAELSLVDATLANKPRAAVFRVVDCEGYTPQPFVGGRLMPTPGPPSGGGGAGEQPPRICRR